MWFAATVKAVHSGDLGFLRCRHFYITLTGEKRLGWSPVATNGVPDWCDPHERVMIEPRAHGSRPRVGCARAGRPARMWALAAAPCQAPSEALFSRGRRVRLPRGVMSCIDETLETTIRTARARREHARQSTERSLGGGTSMTCFDCADSSGVAQCKGPLISCRALCRRPREVAARSVSRGSDAALGRPVLTQFHETFRGRWAVQHGPAPAHAGNRCSQLATKKWVHGGRRA
jgi:hypothetical protein